MSDHTEALISPCRTRGGEERLLFIRVSRAAIKDLKVVPVEDDLAFRSCKGSWSSAPAQDRLLSTNQEQLSFLRLTITASWRETPSEPAVTQTMVARITSPPLANSMGRIARVSCAFALIAP
jgi:hypothetical protein